MAREILIVSYPFLPYSPSSIVHKFTPRYLYTIHNKNEIFHQVAINLTRILFLITKKQKY